jgi:hypothetical protein
MRSFNRTENIPKGRGCNQIGAGGFSGPQLGNVLEGKYRKNAVAHRVGTNLFKNKHKKLYLHKLIPTQSQPKANFLGFLCCGLGAGQMIHDRLVFGIYWVLQGGYSIRSKS